MATKKPTKTQRAQSKQRRKRKKKPMPLHMRLIVTTEEFLNDLNCAREMFEVIVPTLNKMDDQRKKKIKETAKYFEAIKKDTDHKSKTVDKIKTFVHIKSLIDTLKKMHRANEMFRCNSIVLLVAKFDEFLSDVLRVLFKSHPDHLKSPDKALTYEEILELESLDEVLDKFMNKEIEKVLRLSHEEQLEYLDSRLKLGLKEHFALWNNFIEITERRNLYAHTGGHVNRYYLRVCKEKDIKLESKIRENSYLPVTEQYFESAYKCIFELGVRISQSVLRRIFPDKLKEADRSFLNNIGIPLEENKQWELAKIIFDFALSMPQKFIFDDESYKVFIINSCICLKQIGQKKEMRKLLESVDWSSANQRFLLAIHVIKNEYPEAEALMSTMNAKEPIDEHSFRTWPLFLEFRETENFARAFKKIYKKDYEPIILDEIASISQATD